MTRHKKTKTDKPLPMTNAERQRRFYWKNRNRIRKIRNEEYEQKKACGVCPRCGKTPKPGYILCPECLEKAKIYREKKRID